MYLKRVLMFVLIMLAGVPAAFGQVVSSNGGSIQGDITDPSGAKVPSATVTVSSPSTGYSKVLKTDSAGFYSLGPLTPGDYKVKVEAQGFQTLDVSTVIRTGTATSGTFKLSLGSSSETIEVAAGALQVNTDQAGVSDVLTQEQIQSLPVNGRNFLDLAQIEPGVILQAGSGFDPTKAGYSAISVGGVSGRTTRILLDGQDITDENVGTTIFNVSEGAIGEFQLNRSTQDASGEVTSTGQVLVSTQAGTNRVHGQAFYNFQDARAAFADANVNSVKTNPDGSTSPLPNPYYQRNQFGGSVGGPIIHDKLFFFANSERIKQTSQTPANLGTFFQTINGQYTNITTPYKEIYSTGRLDYSGPFGGHYFVRGSYEVNGADRNPTFYELYTNRDNTYGIAGGVDLQRGKLTHSFRVSYEKFHNFITDHTQGNSSVYDPIQGLTLAFSGQVAFGPNGNVPQATYQSDKQFRYDGSWTRGAHIFRFGYSLNRILGGGFFEVGGLAPSVTIAANSQLLGTPNGTYNPLAYSCSNGAPGGAACTGDPINGYATSALTIYNGLGGENEFPAFGLPGGGLFDWREGAYVQDSWKVTPSFTFTGGLRWSVDTGRANQDLDLATCADIGAQYFKFANGFSNPCGSVAASTPLFSLWNPGYTYKVHQPYGNFAPQIGLAYAPGNHKTVFRSAIGMFFESDVFNNAINSRGRLLKNALGYASLTGTCSAYQLTLPTPPGQPAKIITSTPDGTDFHVACQRSVASSAPQWIALQTEYQNAQKAVLGSNGTFIGNTLLVSGQYAPNYRTPYGLQYNFGIQRELRRGLIISSDYVHNSTLHISQTLDQNHVGAARTFNQANAINAVQSTLTTTCKGATSVQAAITPGGCSGGSGSAAGGKFATIRDFAVNGLDSGVTYLSSGPASYAQKSVTGPNGVVSPQGAAFPGLNQNLGVGTFITPSGRSGYDALQIVLKQQATKPLPGIMNTNFQISYSLSRIVATTTSADEFFDPAVIDKDNPSAYIGRSANDHKHEISFGGSATLKYGPRISGLAHFFSASPTTLVLDTAALSNGQVFQTDVTGDGTTADVAPGTVVGAYMHSVKPENLNSYINNFNATQAGKLTPAGQAVVSGLAGTTSAISAAQLVQMGGAIQPVAQVANANGQTRGVANPAFRQIDASVSYPIKLRRLREGMVLEPGIAFYNVGNFSNFANNTGTLQNVVTAAGTTAGLIPGTNQGVTTPVYNTATSGNGFITGTNTLLTQASKRTVRNIGTFASGAQRSAEFQLKLNF